MDDNPYPRNENAVSFARLESGVYSLSRTHAAESTLQRIECLGGVSQVDLATESLTIFLRPDDAVVCTFVDLGPGVVASPPPT